MADENVIGLEARLDTEQFTAGTKRLDAMVASLEKNLDSFEKKQEDNARRVSDATRRATDEQEKAHKKAGDAAETHAKKQNQAMDRIVGKFRSAAYLISGVAAGLVLVYKKLGDAATEFGDTEAIAKFDAMDASIAKLEDTVLAAGLEFEKTANIVGFFTGIAQTAAQAVSILTYGLTFLAEAQRALAASGTAGLGIEDLGKPENFAKAQAQADVLERARQKANEAFEATLTAPERSKQTTLAADAEKEANKQRAKTAQNIHDYNEKIRELQTKSGESILEAEKDFHDKSAEAWQSYMDKVASITADGIQERAKLTRDYSDKISAAEIDYQRGVEDASYNHGKKLADIERDYQSTIRNIQQTYQEDALDAIRNLDAIGLIRAREKRDKDLANARTSRDEANAAEGENYTRQLYELQRSLDDKRREAEIAYQRGLEEQRIAEQAALQSAKDAYNQQNAETRKALDDKLAAINQSYANENAAAAAQYGYSEAALRAHMQEMQNIMRQYGIRDVTAPTGPRVRRRAEGGLDIVSSPTQFVAGEAGPEMVYTAPLNRSIPAPVMQTVNHVGDFSHNIDAAISSSVAGLDGRITATVRKAIAEVIR